MDFLEYCDEEAVTSHGEIESKVSRSEREEAYGKSAHGRKFVSLVDGIAADLDTGAFCKIKANSLLAKLQQRTYMQDYEKVIKAAQGYSLENWRLLYRTTGSSQSRVFCKEAKQAQRGEECPPDGLDWRKKTVNSFLAPLDVCSGCAIVTNSILDPTGVRKAVDCTQKKKSVNETN